MTGSFQDRVYKGRFESTRDQSHKVFQPFAKQILPEMQAHNNASNFFS